MTIIRVCKKNKIKIKPRSHLWVMNTGNIRILVSQVARSTIHGYLHRGHRGVVVRRVRQSGPLLRKPHGTIRTNYLLCERNNKKSITRTFI